MSLLDLKKVPVDLTLVSTTAFCVAHMEGSVLHIWTLDHSPDHAIDLPNTV